MADGILKEGMAKGALLQTVVYASTLARIRNIRIEEDLVDQLFNMPKRILVVAGEEDIRQLLKDHLESNGYVVESALMAVQL